MTNPQSVNDFIERNYPFASDDAKQTVRERFAEMSRPGRSLYCPEIPSIVDRFNAAVTDCKASHEFKTNELFELAFFMQGDRRNGTS